MPVKKYTQNGILSMMLLLPLMVICIVLLFITGVDEPVTVIIFSFVLLTFIVSFLVFFKMTIIIDDTHLTFSMGIGLVRKSYPLSEIASCKPVTTSVLSGVGIHMTSSGWLYNVSGKYAIELTFKSSGRRIRIGTDKPDEIAEAVTKQINGSMAGSYYDRGGHGGLYLILAMIAATAILPVLLVVYGGRETEITFSDSGFSLNGIYGLTIPYSDILSADTMESLPAIRSRTNGYSSGKILKGHFKLQDQSRVLLFIKKGTPPYILIKTSGSPIYLNFDTPRLTRQVFVDLRNRIDNRDTGYR
jgi:hypothetical protein